jgi:phenylpropionate dioxygenase-like ring-hydroxylating dioxygenase large terminal subunit
MGLSAIEPMLWDDWHVVAEVDTVVRTGRQVTTLLGTRIVLYADAVTGAISAATQAGRLVPVQRKYGLVWVCLGEPGRDIVDFAECADEDRLVVTGGPVAVAVSGLRAVENFLDMGHFAFVHTGYLGEEPFTEIKSYKVERPPEGGILATGCRVWQPLASPVATEGFEVEYIYAVPRPYTVLLQKANPIHPERKDLIVLFVQPVSEESCVAHLLMVYLKDGVDQAGLRRFGQLIFAQDKPILENQLPKRLPLGPQTEIPVRADASSAQYRRWLQESGIRYGAIPAA